MRKHSLNCSYRWTRGAARLFRLAILLLAVILVAPVVRAQLAPEPDAPPSEAAPNPSQPGQELPPQSESQPQPQFNSQPQSRNPEIPTGSPLSEPSNIQQQPGAASAATSPPVTTLRVSVNLVDLFFLVHDKAGKLIPNLTQADCNVFEDDKPQKTEKFCRAK